MYIETSRPRQAGDRARLLSPLYNVTAARGPTGSTRAPYCVSFYYHMNGKHIGESPGIIQCQLVTSNIQFIRNYFNQNFTVAFEQNNGLFPKMAVFKRCKAGQMDGYAEVSNVH